MVFAVLIFLVPSIYVFRFHKKLIIGGVYSRAFTASCYLFALGGVVLAIGSGLSRDSNVIIIASISPLVHNYIFKYLYHQFIRIVGREPKDVSYNFAQGLGKDRTFAFIVYLGFTFLSFAFLLFLPTGVVH